MRDSITLQRFHVARARRSQAGAENDLQMQRKALAQTWIVYHLAAAHAQVTLERGGKRRLASGHLTQVALDIHHFVLAVCSSCLAHHSSALQETPIRSCDDFERWVFNLHNSVNKRLRLAELPDSEFEAVRTFYRASLKSLGPRVTSASLSRNLPTLRPRFCHSC